MYTYIYIPCMYIYIHTIIYMYISFYIQLLWHFVALSKKSAIVSPDCGDTPVIVQLSLQPRLLDDASMADKVMA